MIRLVSPVARVQVRIVVKWAFFRHLTESHVRRKDHMRKKDRERTKHDLFILTYLTENMNLEKRDNHDAKGG